MPTVIYSFVLMKLIITLRTPVILSAQCFYIRNIFVSMYMLSREQLLDAKVRVILNSDKSAQGNG